MNTLHFSYAIEIERTGSITKAAQHLFMAQPNLSKALKELEEQLGYEIFERTPGGMIPTEKGSNFLIHARNIIGELEEMEAIGGEQQPDVQQLCIAIPRGSYIANGCTEFVAQLNPEFGIEVTIQETNSMQAINNVAHEKFNLGIIRYQSIYENYYLDYAKSKQLKYEPVWEFQYVAVMSKDNPMAKQPEVKADELMHYIELSHADLMIPYVDMKSMELQERPAEPGKNIYVYDRGCQFDLLTRIPSTYMWVSPIPDIYLKQYGLVQKKCNIPNNNYKDVLVYKDGYEFSQWDLKFMEKLYESRDAVAKKNIQGAASDSAII